MRLDWGGSRRAFLGQGCKGAFALGAMSRGRVIAASPAGQGHLGQYDLERLREVDPGWVGYERVLRFPVGHPAARRLTWDPAGRWLVAAGTSVLVFSPEGQRLGEVPMEDPVRCVRADRAGAWWVGFRERIEVWDAHGTRIARWPRFEGRPFLSGLAVTEHEVWVADSGNRVVLRCSREGRVELRVGERDAGGGVPGLVVPSPWLTVEGAEDGRVWVTNPGRHRVEVYRRDGVLERSWGRPGVAIESFCGCCNPVGMARLPDGRCVTSEKGLSRVKVFSAEGRLESVVAVPDDFEPLAGEGRGGRSADASQDGLDVAVEATGRVAVLDRSGSTIQIFQQIDRAPGAV